MPPKLPPDALRAPPASARADADPMPSPFDNQVIASSPAPTPARGALNPSLWMDRQHFPLVKPEHAEELEQMAAVNEFSRRMPREKAEAEAYAHYRDKQHKDAAVHHLLGQRAASAAGDLESARKHSLMYGLHSKALGHDLVGPVHPDVQAGLSAAPPRVYRYKAHKGDMLALAPHTTEHGATASAPAPQPMGKREVDALLVLRKACEVLRKGDVVGEIPGPTVKQPPVKRKHVGFNDMDLARARRWAKDKGYEDKSKKPEVEKKEKDGDDEAMERKSKESREDSATTCSDCGGYKPHWAQRCLKCYKEREGLGKAEKLIRSGSACRCDSYNFPHRSGGGKCRSSKK